MLLSCRNDPLLNRPTWSEWATCPGRLNALYAWFHLRSVLQGSSFDAQIRTFWLGPGQLPYADTDFGWLTVASVSEVSFLESRVSRLLHYCAMYDLYNLKVVIFVSISIKFTFSRFHNFFIIYSNTCWSKCILAWPLNNILVHFSILLRPYFGN